MKTAGRPEDSRMKNLRQPYVWVCLFATLAFQLLAFYGTRLILPYLPSYTLKLPLDERIPFQPEWIIIYCLAYVSWFTSALIILAQGKKHAVRFTWAFAIAMLASGIIFLIFPLTIERPEVAGDGFVRDLVRAIYRADQPNNLCPSLHVLISYFCWRGLWGCPRIPKWFKTFNLIFLVLVCLSILFLKQHLTIDIAGGIIVGEIALQAASHILPGTRQDDSDPGAQTGT